MMITNKLKLDLQTPGTTPTVNAVQTDSYSRNLEITLYSDHRPFIFPEKLTVVIRYKKSDGKGGEYDTLPDGTAAWWAERNILTVALAPQVLTTPGSVLLSVTLIADGTQLSIFPIRLAVEPIAAGKLAKSEDYFYITGLLPAPASGKVGQSLRIAAVNSEGRITALAAADSESLTQDVPDPTVYGLPVLYLTGDTTGMSKDNAVSLNYVYGERSGAATVKWQGSSSLAYPKKNYTIQFDNAFEAAAGWGVQKKYCLKANYIDFSHARNIVSAKLWGQIVKNRSNILSGLESLPNGGAVDGFPVCVYINGQYNGLYTFNIPKDGWMFGMGSGTRACVLSAKNHSAATRFEAAAVCDGTDFEIEYISDETDTTWAVESVNRLISTVMNSNGLDIDSTLANYLDIDSAIDFYIFTALLSGGDNVDKNYLLSTYDGVKWFFSTYDMDSTFGNQWTGMGYNSVKSAPTLLDFSNKVMQLVRDYKTVAVKTRYNQLRSTVLSEDNVLLEFVNFIAGIPSALYEQDTKLWPLIPGTKTNNIAQIANNYRLRVQLLDTQIEQIEPAIAFTNLVPISTDPKTGEIFNGTGYNDGVVVWDDYTQESANGYVSTGLISFPAYSITPAGSATYISPVLYVKGNVTWETEKQQCRIVSFKSDGTACHVTTANANHYYNVEELDEGYYKITYTEATKGDGNKEITMQNWIGKYPEKVQLSLKGTGEGLIVTLGEPIV